MKKPSHRESNLLKGTYLAGIRAKTETQAVYTFSFATAWWCLHLGKDSMQEYM